MKFLFLGLSLILCCCFSYLSSPPQTGLMVTAFLLIVSIFELSLQRKRSLHVHKSFATILTNYLLVPIGCLNIPVYMIKYFLCFYAALSVFSMVSRSDQQKSKFTIMALCGIGILLTLITAFVVEPNAIYLIIYDLLIAIAITSIIVYGINPLLDSAAEHMHGFVIYIKPMKRPMIAFFGGYLYVVILFTFINVSLYLISPEQFNFSLANQSRTTDIIAILLYSISTYGIYSYNLVSPNALLSQVIYIIECLIGCGWLAIILAAVIGYLQKEFSEINEKK